jgi:hypothetical protein
MDLDKIELYKTKLDNSKNEFKNSYYKSCGKYIVILKKCMNTQCNEDRLNVYDIENASYRANKMLVYDIIHKIDNTLHIDKIYNTIYPTKVLYEKYKIIECDNYDINSNTIYTNGIHYFKNYKRALYEENEILTKFLYTGYFIEYDIYGQKIQEGNLKNGNKSDQWIIYEPLNIVSENPISFYQSLQLTYYQIFGNNNYITQIYN